MYFVVMAPLNALLCRRINHAVRKLIKIASCIIILLGIVHIGFAFPIHLNTDTLWFVGAGMAIVISGLLNFIAIERGGSKLTKTIAVIANAINCAMFCFALAIMNEPQVYIGISIFLFTTIAFISELTKDFRVRD